MTKEDIKGWFTKRSKKWELINLWFMLIPLFSFGSFSFISLIYMGIAGKKRIWSILGTLSMLVTAFSFSEIVKNQNLLASLLFAISVITTLAYSIFSCKEFLQRLDLRLRKFPLQWSKKYNYDNIDADFESAIHAGNIKALPVGSDFIASLKTLEKEIESEKLKLDIQKMITISKTIMEKDTSVGEIFFERNAETVNKILKKYDELENTRIDTPEMKESLSKLENDIGSITKAFEQELTDMYKNDMVDIDAETRAFLQTLKNRGLIDDNNLYQ